MWCCARLEKVQGLLSCTEKMSVFGTVHAKRPRELLEHEREGIHAHHDVDVMDEGLDA